MQEIMLLEFFKKHTIDYTLYTHEPIFTVDDGIHLTDIIPGAHTKNLFIKDKKKNYFLISVLEDKRVDLNQLSKSHGKGRFSFCNADELLHFLKLTPGSVTPFGLIHDTTHKITFLLDKDLLSYELINFHPLRNDMTVGMSVNSFFTFLESLGKSHQAIDIPTL